MIKLVKNFFQYLLFFLLLGCISISYQKVPDKPIWTDYYQLITDEKTHAFINKALDDAIYNYGEPLFEIKKINVYRSQKNKTYRHLLIQEDFSLTEVIDNNNGHIAIYIGVDPDHPDYYFLLGHEVFHILNPYVKDWYMEGLASVFSEQICLINNYTINDKLDILGDKENPYRLSYLMMKELTSEMPKSCYNLLNFIEINSKKLIWRRLNINKWIDSLSVDEQEKALKIIQPYEKQLSRLSSENTFFMKTNVSK